MKNNKFPTILKLLLAFAVLFTSLAVVPEAYAQAACGDRYTIVKGDTLLKIARNCGTTVAALRRANPEVANTNLIYPGQVLVLPGALLTGTGATDIYIIKRGDILNTLANRFNTTVDRLLELNRDITNRNRIYEGQRLVVPSSRTPAPPAPPTPAPGQTYVVVSGDTLRKIAAKFEVTVADILKLNPTITDPNKIFPGQRIVIPTKTTSYTVVRGDTLRSIATRFNTTVARLLELNPSITNANLIYPGQVIRIG